MIASLSGTVLRTSSSQLVLDVSGVGYLLNVTSGLGLSTSVGAQLTVHTALVVREDSLSLFGFSDQIELEIFDLLRSVTGVGPKLALAILASLGSDQVRAAVASEDDTLFKTVSGVGPKTAKVIAASLAGKLTSTSSTGSPNSTKEDSELVTALVGLGWNERLASEAVKEAGSTLRAGATREELLRAALNRLAAGKSISGGES